MLLLIDLGGHSTFAVIRATHVSSNELERETREHKCLVVPMPITLLVPRGDGANGEMHTENFKIEFFLLYFNIK